MSISDDEVEAALASWFGDDWPNMGGLPRTGLEDDMRAALSAAAKVRAIREGEWVREVEALIDEYWDLAFVEGESGRTTDRPDGDAQRVRSAISQLLSLNATQEGK